MPHATRPGDVLGSRYRLVDLLTESGEGRFWRAYDRVLERHVAIHVIAAADRRAPDLMAAARRSATVLDRRILRVLDAEHDDDVCYVVNEWGWGASLDVVVTGAGALGPRRASWLVSEVADSIAVAHAAGVAHGRLNPENVLVDRSGNVRIIGLCVDAALHGTPTGSPEADQERDVADLAGLLYCALTTRWAGWSGSAIPPAPREHGEVLRPRQVRAGVPRVLDSLCDEVLQPGAHKHRELPDDVRTARGVWELLADFVGDPAGMPEALLASTPDVLPDAEQVVLPQVPEVRPHGAAGTEADTGTGAVDPASPAPAPVDAPREGDPAPETAITSLTKKPLTPPLDDRPTEAGVPIFDETDDVSWLERRTTPVPPPPPFEEPPERPLFAAESTRTPRAGFAPAPARPDDDFCPFDSGRTSGTMAPVGGSVGLRGSGVGYAGLDAYDGFDGRVDTYEDDAVPGRSWFRLALVIGLVAVLAVTILVAFNLGRGRTPLGFEPDDEPSASARAGGAEVEPVAVEALTATAYDPFDGAGDGENDDDAPNAVDGDPATTWSTSGYNDQLGPPPGLKTGVGLVVDLGETRTVTEVDLTFAGAPTSVSLYLADEPPPADGLDGLDPVSQGSTDEDTLALAVGGATGRYLVVWLTALPQDPSDGRYRAEVGEVGVLAEPTDAGAARGAGGDG